MGRNVNKSVYSEKTVSVIFLNPGDAVSIETTNTDLAVRLLFFGAFSRKVYFETFCRS